LVYTDPLTGNDLIKIEPLTRIKQNKL
jgi:hypothetical protein